MENRKKPLKGKTIITKKLSVKSVNELVALGAVVIIQGGTYGK